MAKRTTIADVSRESGVSVATVDRVLNGRAKVREETARKVYDAAVKLGYHAAGLIAQRIDEVKPEYRIAFVLHKERQDFSINLRDALERAAQDFPHARFSISTFYAENSMPTEFAKAFRMAGKRAQAVAGLSVDHHEVTGVIRLLRNEGIATFSLLNDFAQGVRESYIGTNNVKLGRGTAWLLSKVAKQGKVALFVGGYRWHGHELRETGFRSYFRESEANFELLDTLVNLETRQLAYEATLELLNRHHDLTALYCAGGGMEGVIKAIREERSPGEITVAVNEDTPTTRSALQDGYLTFANVTPIDAIARATVQDMVRSIEQGLTELPRQQFFTQSYLFPELL